jgi:alpha-amylase
MMPKVCLCFHVHQPVRLSRFSYFGIGSGDAAAAGSLESRYFDDGMNRHYFDKAADQCYLPTNRILQGLLDENRGKFRFSLSITGTLLAQAKKYRPEVVESFRSLCQTGRVDVLDETYYHSLASLYADMGEFCEQVRMHNAIVRDLLGVAPKSFRNTEAIYSDRIAQEVEALGYKAIITEGVERVLGWRSPNYVYRPQGCRTLKLLMRNYKLSDDVGFRFSARSWEEWPLTAGKYAAWLSATPGQVINLFMDYETFGEHHWKDTGILDFLAHLPFEAHRRGNIAFSTVTEAAQGFEPCDTISVPGEISWADAERNTSTWLGNRIQRACFDELESLLARVRKANDAHLWEAYRLLQTSDHLMYLSTKGMSDREVHNYFSPYKDSGPYENFISFMNILSDFKEKVEAKIASKAAGSDGRADAGGLQDGKKETLLA